MPAYDIDLIENGLVFFLEILFYCNKDLFFSIVFMAFSEKCCTFVLQKIIIVNLSFKYGNT